MTGVQDNARPGRSNGPAGAGTTYSAADIAHLRMIDAGDGDEVPDAELFILQRKGLLWVDETVKRGMLFCDITPAGYALLGMGDAP